MEVYRYAPRLLPILLLMLVLLLSGISPVGRGMNDQHIEEDSSDMIHTPAPSHFIRNLGQVGNREILYYSEGGSLQVGFMERGLQYLVRNDDTGYAYNVSFVGANRARIVGAEPLPHRSNYFLGSDEERWMTNVQNYGRLTYLNIYNDIDLTFYTDDGSLKYDLIVHPGGSVSDIKISFQGANPELVDDELIVSTPLGVMVEGAPISFSEDGTEVPTSWHLSSDGIASYVVSSYDDSTTLTIDPLLTYSTYVGGSTIDNSFDMDIDGNGNVYVVGYTQSANFPTTTGAYDTGHNGNNDVFVFKLSSSGGSIIYSTFLGGSSNDYGYGIDVDTNGNAYVVGQTKSNNYPTTSGAYDTTYQRYGDVFVTKLGSSGNQLGYSTYIGKWGADVGRSIVVDSSGCVFITGYTSKFDIPAWCYPVTSGAYDTTHNSNYGGYDAFITKLSSNGGSLTYSTYLGGSNQDYGFGIDLDSSGNAYVVGYTLSSNFPTTSGAYDQTANGNNDLFVTKINAAGSSLSFSTYIGGSGSDKGNYIRVDGQNRPCVTGKTDSSGYPTSTNAYQPSYRGSTDGFLTLLTSSGGSIVNSTFIGGSGYDVGKSLDIDKQGMIYLSGLTASTNFPTTSNALYSSGSGNNDAFVMRMNMSHGGGLIFSTYLGGGSNDYASGVVVDRTYSTYLMGITSSSNFPITSSAYDTTHNGNNDVFVSQIQFYDVAPRNLTAQPGIFHVNLSWDAPPNVTEGQYFFKNYTLYRGSGVSTMTPLVRLGNIKWYNDTIPGYRARRYYYAVTATFHILGEGDRSNIISTTQIVPPPPTEFNVSAGDQCVNLTWDILPQVYLEMFNVSYTVYKGLSRAYLFPVAYLGVRGTYNDTEISDAPRAYFYAVSYTFQGIGEGIRSSTIETWPNTPPSAPTALTGTAEHLRINLLWAAPLMAGGHDIAYYTLYRGDSPTNLIPLATLDPYIHDHMDTSVTPGRYGYYAISCSNILGESPISDAVEVWSVSVPSAPRALISEPGDERITLTWEAPEQTWRLPLTTYSLYGGTSPDNMTLITTVDPSGQMYVDRVENGVTYFYELSASNMFGEGPNTDVIFTMASGIPGRVMNLSAGFLSYGMILKWEEAEYDGGTAILFYRVYRSPTTYDEDKVLLDEIPTGGLEYRDITVVDGETYHYWISAVNINGEGPISDMAYSSPGRIPGRIETFNVGVSLFRVNLLWEPPAIDGGKSIENFRIYRGDSPASIKPYTIVSCEITSFLDKGLEGQRPYYYAVSAVNSFGEGPISGTVTATPTGDPDGPNILDAEAFKSSIYLKWDAPCDDGGAPIEYYKVILMAEGLGTSEEPETEELQITVHGLIEGMTYTVSISTINQNGGIGTSNTIVLLVGDIPEPPRNIQVKPLDRAVEVTWEGRGIAEVPILAYRIYMDDGDGELYPCKEVGSEDRKMMIMGLINGVKYSIAMSSVNVKGEGVLSRTLIVIPYSHPDPVENLRVQETGNGFIKICWESPVYTGGVVINGYEILRGKGDADIMYLRDVGKNTFFYDDNVDNGAIYHYMVSVKYDKGQGGSISREIKAMALGPPSRPRMLNAEGTTDTVALTWEMPIETGGSPILGYILYRSVGKGDFSVHSYLGPEETSFSDLDISKGSYTYCLVPFTAYGPGEWSDVSVDIPSRKGMAIGLATAALILSLLIVMMISFLPGIIRRRREEKERLRDERREKENREALERELILLETRARKPLLGGAVASNALSPMGRMAAPVFPALRPAEKQVVSFYNSMEEVGYIRPTDKRRKVKDKASILRPDGRTLEQRLGIHEIQSDKVHEEKHEWHDEMQKAIEKEAMSTFLGEQKEHQEEGIQPPMEPGQEPVSPVVADGEVPD